MKTCLITGIDGFIGSALALALSQNFRVIGLARNKENLKRLEKNLFSIYNYDELSNIFIENTVDYVIHMATSYDTKDIVNLLQTNLMFPITLFKLCVENKVAVFLNTDSFYTKDMKLVYGNKSEYTLSKYYSKLWFKQFSNDIKVINVQLEHVYGSGDNPQKFVPSILQKLILNEKQINLTEGRQKRDFVNLIDVVDAYKSILNNIDAIKNNYTNIQLGTGVAHSIREFAVLAKEITGSTTELMFGAIPCEKNEISESKADISYLKSFGFIPKYTLLTGLKKVIQHDFNR